VTTVLLGSLRRAGMRHLFDQYDGNENRLTHALACCLAEDRELLGGFIEWSTGQRVPAPGRLRVLEQQLPGGPVLSEAEVERRGLPDICIHDDSWCLVVESKLGSPLVADQLRRHRSTVARRGFEAIDVLAICPDKEAPGPTDGLHYRSWVQVCQWATEKARASAWARRLITYLEVVEMRLDAAGIERDWSLTTFAGIPFGRDEPYEYRQAKRLLPVAMAALRQREDLQEQLGIAVDDAGRGKITGREADGVWDTLRFSCMPAGEKVQGYPHLTLAIGQQDVLAILVLPNGLRPEFRNRLRALGEEGFADLLREITHRMSGVLSGVTGWVPWAEVTQRHYPSRSGSATEDAQLAFDLHTTSVPEDRHGPRGARPQPLWAKAAFEAFAYRRRANTQLAVGGRFPYDHCRVMQTPKALDCIATAWIACKPAVDLIFHN
jgi:hypothetical protein